MPYTSAVVMMQLKQQYRVQMTSITGLLSWSSITLLLVNQEVTISPIFLLKMAKAEL